MSVWNEKVQNFVKTTGLVDDKDLSSVSLIIGQFMKDKLLKMRDDILKEFGTTISNYVDDGTHIDISLFQTLYDLRDHEDISKILNTLIRFVLVQVAIVLQNEHIFDSPVDWFYSNYEIGTQQKIFRYIDLFVYILSEQKF